MNANEIRELAAGSSSNILKAEIAKANDAIVSSAGQGYISYLHSVPELSFESQRKVSEGMAQYFKDKGFTDSTPGVNTPSVRISWEIV